MFQIRKKKARGLPWWSSGRDSKLPVHRARVRSLVKERDPTCCKLKIWRVTTKARHSQINIFKKGKEKSKWELCEILFAEHSSSSPCVELVEYAILGMTLGHKDYLATSFIFEKLQEQEKLRTRIKLYPFAGKFAFIREISICVCIFLPEGLPRRQWYRVCLQCWRLQFHLRVGKIPGDGNGNPLQLFLPEISRRGDWQATVHGVAKRGTRLRTYLLIKH